MGEEPQRAPATFRGWQRGACIGGVMILALLTTLLLVAVILQLLGVR
ncbi:MAG: hypothetical protein M0T72_11030 [Candidatus Dormibacteraeota bacterium]|nr:hypothetical protein [Candidatus Dormibacteraeota bacterium]